MFLSIAKFEFRFQTRNPVFWVAAGIFFLLTFGAMTVTSRRTKAAPSFNDTRKSSTPSYSPPSGLLAPATSDSSTFSRSTWKNGQRSYISHSRARPRG